MTRRGFHFGLLGLMVSLLAACALPVAPPSSAASSAGGTASLVITTPYGPASRAVLLPIQMTVEPATLASAFAYFEVTLTSPTQGSVAQTVLAANIGTIRFDNLPEANDWVVEILAYNAAKVPLGRFWWKQGGIATVKDKTTEWGQAVISALPGKGDSPFQLTISDLPTGLSNADTWVELDSLADNGAATALDSVSSAKVKSRWVGSTLTIETLASTGHLSPGTYRMTVHFVTSSGVAASVTPIFILNLYPTLTSTATVSAAPWSSPDPAPGVTIDTPLATAAGLVLSWTPSESGAVGYQYVWYPTSADPPSASALDPDNLPTQAREGFLIAGSNSKRLRPSWLIEAGTPYDSDRAEVSWTLYVRSLGFDGSWGEWSTRFVDLSALEFPLLLHSLTFAGGDLWGPTRIVKTEQPDLHDGTFVAQPERASAGLDVDPLSPAATVTLSPKWSVLPGEELTVKGLDMAIPVSLAAVDRSTPGKSIDLFLYEGQDSSQHLFLSAREMAIPTPGGRVGRFQRTSLMSGEGLVSSGSFPVPGELPGASVSVQMRPFGWNKLRQRDVPTADPSDLTLDTPRTVSTVFSNDHYWVRPVYTFFDGSAIAGPWVRMVQVEATMMPDKGLMEGVGRYSHIIPALEGGWLATGYAGQGMGRVFVTRLTPGGTTDQNFGTDAPGISYQNASGYGWGGVYFARSIGLVQNQTNGALIIPSYFQNGVGNVLLRGFTSSGNADLTFGSPNGFLQLNGPYRVPVGQPVGDGASLAFLEWNEGSGQYGITKVNMDGSASSAVFLTGTELDALARFPGSGNWIAVGITGKVVVTDPARALLTSYAGGSFTLTVGSAPVRTPNWTAVTVDALGRAILVGIDGTDGVVARLTTAGLLDTSFNGGNGFATLPGLFPYAVTTTVAREIVVAGDNTVTEASNSAGFVRRYVENGTGGDIDEILPTPLASSSGYTWGTGARSVAVAPDGSITVAGFTKLLATPLSSTVPTLWRFVP